MVLAVVTRAVVSAFSGADLVDLVVASIASVVSVTGVVASACLIGKKMWPALKPMANAKMATKAGRIKTEFLVAVLAELKAAWQDFSAVLYAFS